MVKGGRGGGWSEEWKCRMDMFSLGLEAGERARASRREVRDAILLMCKEKRYRLILHKAENGDALKSYQRSNCLNFLAYDINSVMMILFALGERW